MTLTGKTKSGICSVSKVYRVKPIFSKDTNGGGVRKPSKGPSIALWRHEFYAVFSSNPRLKGGKKEVDIYQALEFRKGMELPEEFAEGLSEKQRLDGIRVIIF